MINYFRRFQKTYLPIKSIIARINEKVSIIKIRYHRGILNNASHAFDLINYLFEIELSFSDVVITKKMHDFFKKDPTITFDARFRDIEIIIEGIDTKESILEIEIFFNIYKINFSDKGNRFALYKKGKLIQEYNSLLVNYMEDVYSEARKILINTDYRDNFISSLNLNRQLINDIL